MPYSGTQVTRLGLSGITRGLTGSFDGKGETVVVEEFSGGYFPKVYKYRPRVRYKFKDEEEKQAAKIVEQVIEKHDNSTNDELERILKQSLRTKQFLYKGLYLVWLKQEKRKKDLLIRKRRDEEVIILTSYLN